MPTDADFRQLGLSDLDILLLIDASPFERQYVYDEALREIMGADEKYEPFEGSIL